MEFDRRQQPDSLRVKPPIGESLNTSPHTNGIDFTKVRSDHSPINVHSAGSSNSEGEVKPKTVFDQSLQETVLPEETSIEQPSTPEVSSQNSITIGGNVEDWDVDFWKEVLEDHIPSFTGDTQRGAEIMYSFISGKEGVQALVEGTDIVLPDITLITDDTDLNLTADIGTALQPSGPAPYIKNSILEDYAERKNEWHALIDEKGDVYYRGTRDNYLKLTGYEEFHHAAWMQVHELDENDPNHNSTLLPGRTVDEYHAQTVEYHALLGQLDFAKSEGMNELTIKTIEEHVGRVSALREAQGLPIEGFDFKDDYERRMQLQRDTYS